MPGAFDGVRILDFSGGIAGPMATMILADHGAEVIKVEPPGGDPARHLPGYLAWNRNKRVVTLDVHRLEGLRSAREMLRGADVAVFDSLPGELERLGLDAVTVRAANPGIVHAWLPPLGIQGRWSQLHANDDLLMGLTGAGFMQMSYADAPIHLVSPQATYGHAMIAAGAIASALLQKQRDGAAQGVTVSGLHGVSAVETGGAIIAGDVFRMGGSSPRGGVPNYRLYQCADGKWFFLGTLTPQFFLKALQAVDLLDVLMLPGVDGEFTNLLKPENTPTVIAQLDARFAEKPRDEWMRILHENDVPIGPVGDRDEWFRGETVAINGMRVTLDDPKLGRVEMPGVSVKLADTPGEVRHLPTPARLDGIPARTATAASVATTAPLAGVCVLDLGAFIAGTFAPTVLANFGADVIKVEPIDGDPFRIYGLGFIGYNRGKRSLALDLKSPEGKAAFLDLVRGADIVLDNYRLGVRERLGIDYASLAAVNPRIITCSVTGYGPQGELSAHPGFDPLVQARSGMMAAQGGDDEPVFHQIPVNDTATAMMAAFGCIAALHARERTGRGQEVQTSLANQSVLCQSGELTWFEGRPDAPVGGRDCPGKSALQRFYPCAGDQWVVLAAATAEQFHAVCVALGHPEWAGRMTAEQALCEPAQGRLAEDIAAALAAIDREEALDRLNAHGVPAVPALRLADMFSDPYLEANRFLEAYEHPAHGIVRGVRSYADWQSGAGGFVRRAPLVGEHSAEVLGEFGFDERRIAELVASGVVRAG